MTPSKILIALGLCLVAIGLWRALPSGAAEPETSVSTYIPLLGCDGVCDDLPTPTVTTTPGGYAANRLRAIELINIERAKVGCPAVRIVDTLMRAAQDWAVYMDSNADFRHAPVSHYQQYGYPQGVLENIGVAGTPEQFVEAMLESPLHKDNMLSCRYHDPANPSFDPDAYYEIGVGESNFYWVMSLVPKHS